MEGKNNQNKKEMTMDDLARIVQDSFLSVEGRLDGVKEKLDKLEINVKEVKLDTEDIKAELNKKVDTITHNTLTYRVEKLEEKFA
jgi:hypothetical protein